MKILINLKLLVTLPELGEKLLPLAPGFTQSDLESNAVSARTTQFCWSTRQLQVASGLFAAFCKPFPMAKAAYEMFPSTPETVCQTTNHKAVSLKRNFGQLMRAAPSKQSWCVSNRSRGLTGKCKMDCSFCADSPARQRSVPFLVFVYGAPFAKYYIWQI